VYILLAKIAKSYLQFYLHVSYLLDQAEEMMSISYNAIDMIFRSLEIEVWGF